MLKKIGHGKAVDWYLLGVLIHEMLLGSPPYFARTKEEIFFNIENHELNLPNSLSKDARHILKGLLNKNPLRRLGSGILDVEEIKRHAWFEGINWDRIRERSYQLPHRFKPVTNPLPPGYQIATGKGHEPIEDFDVKDWSFVQSHNPTNSF